MRLIGIAPIVATTIVMLVQPTATPVPDAEYKVTRTSGNGCTYAEGYYRYFSTEPGRYTAYINSAWVVDKCDAVRRAGDGYGGTMRVVYRQWTGSSWVNKTKDFAWGDDEDWTAQGSWDWAGEDVADVRIQACNRNMVTGYVGTCA